MVSFTFLSDGFDSFSVMSVNRHQIAEDEFDNSEGLKKICQKFTVMQSKIN